MCLLPCWRERSCHSWFACRALENKLKLGSAKMFFYQTELAAHCIESVSSVEGTDLKVLIRANVRGLGCSAEHFSIKTMAGTCAQPYRKMEKTKHIWVVLKTWWRVQWVPSEPCAVVKHHIRWAESLRPQSDSQTGHRAPISVRSPSPEGACLKKTIIWFSQGSALLIWI